MIPPRVASIFISGLPYPGHCPLPPLFTFFTCPRMLDCVVSRAPSPSTSSLDDDECSFSPFSKREYLLAQMRQKDELIDSLLKQVRPSYILLTNILYSYSHSPASQSVSRHTSLHPGLPQCNVFDRPTPTECYRVARPTSVLRALARPRTFRYKPISARRAHRQTRRSVGRVGRRSGISGTRAATPCVVGLGRYTSLTEHPSRV